jgi:hypothetical protein
MPCPGSSARRCGPLSSPAVPNVLPAIIGILSAIWSVISIIWTVVRGISGALGSVEVVEGLLLYFAAKAAGPTVTVSFVAAAVVTAFVAAVAVVILIGAHISDRCLHHPGGTPECVAGVVIGAVHSFNSTIDDLFPFTATHDRIDLVVKEHYFDVVEAGAAYVFCTDAPVRRRSPILRCYYFSEEVCNAGRGSLYGAVAGGVAAIVAAAIIAAAVGCSTPIGCLIVLAVIAVVALILVLAGALIGGQAGRAASRDTSPVSDTGRTLREGDYVTVQGNMVKRDYDEGANVLWWETSTQFHGPSTVTARPFNHCDIEADNFGVEMDRCPT